MTEEDIETPKRPFNVGIASMVCGALGFLAQLLAELFSPTLIVGAILVLEVLGLVLGIVGLLRSRRDRERYGGIGLPVGGIVVCGLLLLSLVSALARL